MAAVFGDADPEDAWDDGDPLALRLMLLGRILVDVYEKAAAGEVERSAVRRRHLVRPARRVVAELIDALEL